MKGRFLGRDANTGAVESFDYDEVDDTMVIHRQSLDIQPIIDSNKELANHTDGWTSPAHDMRLAARIPIDVVYIWVQRYGIRVWDKNHWPAVRRLLNDNEWRYLRCSNFII